MVICDFYKIIESLETLLAITFFCNAILFIDMTYLAIIASPYSEYVYLINIAVNLFNNYIYS